MASPGVTTMGKYQILERISSGDLHEVYKARLEGIGGFQRTFAIKRVRPNLAQNTEYATMIEEEARIAGLLSHGNIAQLLDLGRDGGALYIVMEYVDGYDLGAVLRKSLEKGRFMPVSLAIYIAMQLLKGLEYAHDREVMRDGQLVQLDLIHRNVSPANILIGRRGEVKLTDFGIARASMKMMQTHPDLVTRRFDYVSAEAAAGRAIDQRADLFALGVVMYECLAGVHPFKSEGEFATLERIRAGEREALRDVRPDVPPALDALISLALTVDPQNRVQTATAFKEGLMEVVHESSLAFSQEDLAAYLEGLFAEPLPEAAEEVPERSWEPDPTPLFDVDDLEDLPSRPDATAPAPMPLADDIGDAATVVGGRATGFESDGKATVVNPNLVRKLEVLKERGTGGWEEEKTRVRVDVRELLERPEISRSIPRVEPARASMPVAFGMLFIGLLIGSLGALAAVKAAGVGLSDPMLSVYATPGVAVSLDGKAVDGAVPVPANEAQKLQVEVDGLPPWELDLTLKPGEYRLLVVSHNQLVHEAEGGE